MINSENILFVDDEQNILSSIKRVLKDQRNIWNMTFMSNGKEALEACKDIDFDLIVTDGRMQGMSGVELLKILREQESTKHIPTIMLTGYVDKESKKEALKNGVIEFLSKPIVPEEFILRLKNVLYINRITKELKASNEKVKEQNEKLKKLDEEKNQLLGMAAHDIKNPLSVILGTAGLYFESNRKDMNPVQQKHLERIIDSAKHMNSLLNEILDYSSIESGKVALSYSYANIEELIKKNILYNQELALRKHILLELFLDNKFSENIYIDVNKFEEILNNLISNAIKYSFPKTKIIIRLKKLDKNILLSVEDQGQGIPEDEIENIFMPFTKTSVKSTGNEKSNGLGLAIVRKIVEAQNGRIRVESVVGKGSKFIVSIPMKYKQGIN